MKYNFDEIIERSNTASVKYDLRKMFFGTEEVIPMWVADMDFETPPFVMNAIKERAKHPILGYSIRPPEYYEAIVNWVMRRHDWNIKPEWICFSPGIVPALNLAVMAYTKPGDRIIVQPPVYFPFFSAVSSNKRVLSYNQLQMVNGRYQMDYAGLEKLCKKGAAMIIISNPHNPGGNAWRADELKCMSDICLKYDVLMVSDEIHADLVNVGFKHTVLSSLGDAIARKTITMISASKTFNLAALSTASVIISDKKLRVSFNNVVQKLHVDMGNVFGTTAAMAAYNEGDEWLEQLLKYINDNINFLGETLKREIPEIKMIHPEATYMAWLDCSALNLNDKDLSDFFIKEAGLGLNAGIQFGKGGSLYMRINLACPRSLLVQALEQLKTAIEKHRSRIAT